MQQPTREEQTSLRLIPSDKNAFRIAEALRDKQMGQKRDLLICSLMQEAPKSFPKLLNKDLLLLRQLPIQERDKGGGGKGLGHTTLEMRSKQGNKGFFRALEEQHRLINLENMQMLGLTIQKVSYAQKCKKKSCLDGPDQPSMGLAPELLSYESTDHISQNHSFLAKKHSTVVMLGKGRAASSKRPQSIRVRDNASPILQKRRRSMKPINPDYSNPIYQARIFSYRQLLFRLNWSYGNYFDMEQSQQEATMREKRLKAWIGGGNNSPLIRQLIKRRFWWQIVDDRTLQANFIWTQLKLNDYFKRQGSAPLCFIPQKKKLIQAKQLKQTSKQLRRSKAKKQEKQRYRDDEFLNKIMPEFERPEFLTQMKTLRTKQLWERQQIIKLNEIKNQHQKMHNHLTNNFYLGNKKALFYNLKEYYQLIGGNLFKAIPLTFHIKKGKKDPQYKRFIAYHKKRQTIIAKQEKDHQNGVNIGRPMRNIWIVKPGELTNRGNGITVIDQIYELDSIMKSQGKHDNGTQKTFIVQLYIDRPFLYKKRKFDIRHYMMISQLNGVFKAYWYKEGYIRTASYEFDVYNFDREIHLTNDAVQKYTANYGKFESANKLSYAQFQKYLDTAYPKESYNFEDQILPKMKSICLDAVKSSFVKLSPERYKHNFQIFGLDFMIDSEFNPWLIEINTNPCLQLACPLLSRLIPQMVDQALRLTLDVIYPPPCHYPNTAKHLVPDATLESLRFQLIFDERVDGPQLRTLYKKCKGNLLQQIGDISDDEVYQDCGPNNIQLEEIL